MSCLATIEKSQLSDFDFPVEDFFGMTTKALITLSFL